MNEKLKTAMVIVAVIGLLLLIAFLGAVSLPPPA